ncbi:Protein Brevis radix-like 1 [Apostasia shenzhenica]|uniref:Protein Brevis radix-like 1 n=1 Tax=Apostasia shenzhenica TaxID=1088818 RepID=A0A2I0A339_9ASPA|nr:Protein Brevis radix-like 1 [Apostasia shenzhenica]
MLTCIACPKQLGGGSLHEPEDDDVATAGTPSTRLAIKALTSQIKDMALKASGAYRHCKPCAGSESGGLFEESSEVALGSERFLYSYRRACAGGGIGFAGGSCGSTPRLRGLSSGEGTPSASCRTESAMGIAAAFMEEDEEQREWVAQVEPGVLITFISLPRGGNDLRRIRFSRDMFNKWQAQHWWAENYDKVMELYNVHRFTQQSVPLPSPCAQESFKIDSVDNSPVTPPLRKERLPRNRHHQHEHHHHQHDGRQHCFGSGGLMSTPKLSSISGARTETSSVDASVRTSSSPEEAGQSGELSASMSNASDQEREWVEEDEPGVYITIRALLGGIRELRRIRFSRERFGEMRARLWWEENRARIHEQYL